jgi:hypothetical protein
VSLAILVSAALTLCAVPATARALTLTDELSGRLAALPDGPPRAALDAALAAYVSTAGLPDLARPNLLTIIDYTRPSVEPRLWVLDLEAGRVLYRELVAHGRNTGANLARSFSNAQGSLMSSLGLFVTDSAYIGANGYSLRLRGLQPGINDNAFDRAIVIHGAPYVSPATVARLGRLGRSLGCPAVRPAIARALIDTIKNGSVVFAYGGARAD